MSQQIDNNKTASIYHSDAANIVSVWHFSKLLTCFSTLHVQLVLAKSSS